MGAGALRGASWPDTRRDNPGQSEGHLPPASHRRALRAIYPDRARRVCIGGGLWHGRHGLGPAAVLTAVVGFVAAACIWWLYFDHVGSSGIELGPRPAFYWGYGHFAVYAGIAAFGVGVQLAVEAAAPQYALVAGALPSEAYGLGQRTVLAGGVILFLLGIAFVDRINEGTENDRVLLARLVAVALLVLVTALGSLLSPLAFAATVSLVLLA
jgi:low temperature requirement protein LtrA